MDYYTIIDNELHILHPDSQCWFSIDEPWTMQGTTLIVKDEILTECENEQGVYYINQETK